MQVHERNPVRALGVPACDGTLLTGMRRVVSRREVGIDRAPVTGVRDTLRRRDEGGFDQS